MERYSKKRVTLSTKEIYEKQCRIKDGRSAIRIPLTKPLQTDEADLPCDPYLYGYWLGNGTANKNTITVRTCDIGDVKS